MHLTRHTDYAFRILIYLGAQGSEPVPVVEIARSYGISTNHLAKVAQHLIKGGWLKSVRGRKGGVYLAAEPGEINLAAVVEHVEPSIALVECFSPDGTCPITPVCSLQHLLAQAQQAFMRELRAHTLADIVRNPAEIRGLLSGLGGTQASDN